MKPENVRSIAKYGVFIPANFQKQVDQNAASRQRRARPFFAARSFDVAMKGELS